MRIFNADGSEVEACGNASRCVALLQGGDSSIETAADHQRLARRRRASVEMGLPRFRLGRDPARLRHGHRSMPVGWDELQNPAR
jgi:diaminopimelate epimerase